MNAEFPFCIFTGVAVAQKRKNKRKSTFRAVHKWLGLSIAFYFAFQSATGVLMVYRDEIAALWTHSGSPPPSSEKPASLQLIINNLLDKYPSHEIDRIFFPIAPGEPYLAHLMPSDDSLGMIVEADPLSGQVYEPQTAINVIGYIIDLHQNLSIGKAGSYLVGTVGLMLLVSAVTGFWLWWPGYRRVNKVFKIKLTGTGVRALFDLHRVTGSVVVIFILISASTGFVMAFGTPLRAMFNVTIGPEATAAEHRASRLPLRADTLLASTRDAIPDAGIRDIRFRQPGSLIETVVFFRDSYGRRGPFQQAWVDPYTGQVQGVADHQNMDIGNTFFAWMYPIHTELSIGRTGKALNATGGIGILFLAITGPLLWWRKYKVRTSPGSRKNTV